MTARKTGIISEDENQELEKWIEEDEEVRKQWEAFNQRHSEKAVREKLDSYGLDRQDPREIIHADQLRNNRTTLYRLAAVAAVFLLGILGTVYFFYANNNGTNSPLARNKENKSRNKNITLQLADGSTLPLTGTKTNTLHAGAALLTGNGQSLSYAVNGNTANATAINSLTVPTGMDYHIVLSDGTQIWLNSATELRFPFQFSGHSREITVNGEAYLEVAQKANNPFIVHTSRGDIQVLGTAFNMNSYDSGVLNVSLVEGAVRLKTPVKAINLHPGQAAIYRENKGIELAAFDEDQVLSWRKGLFVFNEATLPEITAVLPRWFGIQVSVDNPRLREERFTGVMNRNAPVKMFMENLKTTINIEYYFDKNNTLHIQ